MGNKKSTRTSRDSSITRKHDERRQLNHQKLLETQQKNKEIRLELLKKACEKTRMSEGQLKKEIGTLNSRRLQQVIDGTHTIQDWYILRQKEKQLKNEKKISNSTKKK